MKKIISLVLVFATMALMSVTFADGGNLVSIMPLDKQLLVQNQPIKVSYDDVAIEFDVSPQYVDGKLMVPLKATLEKLGYSVTWNAAEKSVEVVKNAQFTTLYIGKNSYIKNRMAAFELSAAPVIVNGRTLVPVEFFNEVLSLFYHYENNTIMFALINAQSDQELLVTHYGYVKSIEYSETGVRYFLSDSLDEEAQIVVSTSSHFTIFQRKISEGDYIRVVSYPIMLLSYPGQTSAIVVW